MMFGGNFFFYGTFFSYVVFLVVFCFSRWWRSPMGQHVFAFMFVLAVLFALGIARRVTGSAWFDEHRVALSFWSFFATFLVGWWRVLMLIKTQMFRPEETFRERDGDSTDPGSRVESVR